MYQAQAFGVSWISDVPLPLFPAAALADSVDPIRVTLETGPPPPAQPKLSPDHKLQHLPGGLRYTTGDLTIDTQGTDRILLYPGPGWSGSLPFPFFATVSGLLLARRGLLPMHGCAVEHDGQATLICGPSGAGKSTLAAVLLARGARLLSDDLTVLHPDPSAGPPAVFAGRTAIRLHPETASRLGQAVPWQSSPLELEGKLAVFPPCVPPRRPIPLRHVILLTPLIEAAERRTAPQSLEGHFFRPQWIRQVPGQPLRRAALALAARQVRIETRPSLDVAHLDDLWDQTLS